jgi:hypothetical protein
MVPLSTMRERGDVVDPQEAFGYDFCFIGDHKHSRVSESNEWEP